MSLSFCSLSSGSSGNCYVVKSGETVLLVDTGISGRKIFEGLKAADIDPEEVRGILITHEHSDHIKSLRVVSRKSPEAAVYSNVRTREYIKDLVPQERQMVFEDGDEIRIGDIMIRSFNTSHDAADPVGYSFYNTDKQISIVTDTGYVTEDIFSEIVQADLLALEANHDEDVLSFCRYPYYIKRRILGEKGHLSNTAAAECICRLVKTCSKKRRVLLSHLSHENNSPEMARLTVDSILKSEGIYPGEDLEIDVIERNCISPVYVL